jgi:hypothetical protein
MDRIDTGLLIVIAFGIFGICRVLDKILSELQLIRLSQQDDENKSSRL